MIKFKRFLCGALVFVMLFAFFGCAKDVTQADSFLMKIKDKETEVLLNTEDTSVFCDNTALKELVSVSKSDMSALYFSEESYGIAVHDLGSNTLWRSLPKSYGGEKTGVICLNILIDGNEYVLSSQSDSKAMDCTTYELRDDSILITYSFRRTFSDGTKIDITVPVEYKDSDGTLSVTVDCSELVGEGTDENVVLRSISLLPFLGANTTGKEGDFILLPDGSGLTVDTSKKAAEQEVFSVGMYSADPATASEEEENAYAVLPAFGMKVKNGAFVAVIDEGDAISTVRAHRACENGGYNRVYAEFEITPAMKTDKGYYVSSESYDGVIKMSYRFISKSNADYVGMATVCREMLTRNGSLTTGNVDTQKEYPFNLSLIGTDGGRIYTDFAQSYDIISALKGKGINNINLRYKGVLDGTSVNGALDKNNSLREFSDLVSTQGINLFADADIFTCADEAQDKALTLSGKTVCRENDGDEIQYFGADSVSENMNDLLYGLLESDFSGICLNDASSEIYSDYSQGELKLRSDMRDILYAQANAASATKKLMVTRGNLYSLKYADVIVELPDEPFYKTEGCNQVPFVQTVLHGVCEYSLSAINLSEDSTIAFLKAVEYGALPYYEWHHKDGEDARYYLNSVADAKLQYDAARTAFSDLRDEKITAHSKAAENVYLTVYGNNTEIYVNYGEESVTVSGVTVEGRSFIRVN